MKGIANEEIINALQDLRDQIAETKLHQEGAVKEQPEIANIFTTLKSLQAQVEHSMDIEFQGAKLRNIVEDVAERRMNDSAAVRVTELEARLAEMAQKLKAAEEKVEHEVTVRREAEDRESGAKTLLRLSTAEEGKMQEALEDKDKKIKELEGLYQESSMRAVLMEANSQNYQNQQHTLERRLASLEKDLLETRHTSKQWEFEAQKAHGIAQEKKAEAQNAEQEAINLRRTVESMRLQMEESLRVRENFRVKLGQVQERMAAASMEVNKETAQRIKNEQVLISRQEVLDARLQAEARTRERLMNEIERLEAGERESMRAITDAKKLSITVQKLENELHDAEKNLLRYKRELESSRQASAEELERAKKTASEELERVRDQMQADIDVARNDLREAELACVRYKREFEEARESGLSEVQRTRNYMQAEIESANNQVNMVRQELEDQVLRLRSELDNVRLESETARERHDMLLEEAIMSNKKEVNDLVKKHEDKLDDIHAQHEREMSNTVEDAQRAEQHLLERLSLSNAKTEHLQDRVSHLEEKLEIAKSAALAAAEAAKVARERAPTVSTTPYPSETGMPEKISPQALRETIMVLQEQLQNREHTIDLLEQQVADLDPEANTKIAKRDDEINWLRELLAVRVQDLTDIIDTLSKRTFDPEDVRAAAIRLKANLQMEEQERERAMNGGSALNLPNIANSIREAATPRVAQVVGPMAAAWGNWRKNQQNGDAAGRSASPSIVGGAQSFLSGFMTPPASRNVSSTAQPSRALQQPMPRRQMSNASAGSFATPRQRNSQLAREAARERPSPRKELGRAMSRGRGRMGSDASAASQSTIHGANIAPSYSQGSASLRSVEMPAMHTPSTPPMMHRGSYDADARQEDYSDAGFYDDDESTVDESMFGANLGR